MVVIEIAIVMVIGNLVVSEIATIINIVTIMVIVIVIVVARVKCIATLVMIPLSAAYLPAYFQNNNPLVLRSAK